MGRTAPWAKALGAVCALVFVAVVSVYIGQKRTAHHNKQAAIKASTNLAHAFGRAIRQSGNTPFPSSAQVHFTLWQASRTANLDSYTVHDAVAEVVAAFTSSYDDGNPIAGGRGQVTRCYSYAVTRMRALGASVTTRSLKACPRQEPDLRERELNTVYRTAFKAWEQLARDAGGGELTSSEMARAVGPHALVERHRRSVGITQRFTNAPLGDTPHLAACLRFDVTLAPGRPGVVSSHDVSEAACRPLRNRQGDAPRNP
ncbi:hypothetical protein [Streptomyces yatensis]|uniref:Uncharacterized protein n=1 Tax=Streptomyces yatensis TaxID=155177 RepID=A0ABN2IK26_9ACTN|nr:hypothetical protein [Streptomyces yatensis]